MATLKTIKASKHDCMDEWLEEDKVREWLADSGTVQGEDLILTSRIPNVSGRHRLVTQTETELIYDWYVDGCKTLLKLGFEDVGDGTSVSVDWFPKVIAETESQGAAKTGYRKQLLQTV